MGMFGKISMSEIMVLWFEFMLIWDKRRTAA